MISACSGPRSRAPTNGPSTTIMTSPMAAARPTPTAIRALIRSWAMRMVDLGDNERFNFYAGGGCRHRLGPPDLRRARRGLPHQGQQPCLAADRRRPRAGLPPLRCRRSNTAISTAASSMTDFGSDDLAQPLPLAQHACQPDLQFRGYRGAAAAAASATSAPAASAASGDADLSGRLGDPGDRRVPGAASTAASAAAGARTRLLRPQEPRQILRFIGAITLRRRVCGSCNRAGRGADHLAVERRPRAGSCGSTPSAALPRRSAPYRRRGRSSKARMLAPIKPRARFLAHHEHAQLAGLEALPPARCADVDAVVIVADEQQRRVGRVRVRR